MINSYLTRLGFNKTETKIYLALVEVGRSTASLLSKRISIPRTTVYSALIKLIAKGVVSEEKESETTFFRAHKPESLLRLVEAEKEILKEKQDAITELMPLLKPLFQDSQYHVPKIEFFEGDKNVENMLYDSEILWYEDMGRYDRIMWGYQDNEFVDIHIKWLRHYWDNVMEPKKGDKVQLFSNISETEKRLKGDVENREIRPLPEGFKFNSTMWICGDYIIMIMTQQKPYYAFQIKDKLFAENLRQMFQMLWKMTDK